MGIFDQKKLSENIEDKTKDLQEIYQSPQRILANLSF